MFKKHVNYDRVNNQNHKDHNFGTLLTLLNQLSIAARFLSNISTIEQYAWVIEGITG